MTGSAYDFALLVTQRLHRDDTDLVAVGADADEWLDRAGVRRPARTGEAAAVNGFWTEEQVALQETARGFVAARWCRTCRSGRTPGRSRASCTATAAKQGLLGVAFPEEVGGEGGDLLDARRA